MSARQLTPLEIAASIVFGRDEGASASLRSQLQPRQALEAALLDALRKPPCLVSYSGGRDSSALLALAVHVARRSGLPDPIPITARYPRSEAAEESSWQELSVRHLKVREWIVRSFTDEVDLVGPIATELMSRRGLPYPYNLHLQQPLIAEATGGTFVTGLGGDEAFLPAPRAVGIATGALRPRARDALVLAAALAPRSIRRAWLARTQRISFAWLRPEANGELTSAAIDEAVRQPLRWDRALREWWRTRYLQMTMANISEIGVATGVRVQHPFADSEVIAALAAAGGAGGFRDRSTGLAALFGDVLPPKVPGRSDKATFDDVLWNKHSRAFVREVLIDERAVGSVLESAGLLGLVDPMRLLDHWSKPHPRANSFLLLQACWLARWRAAPAEC